MISKKQAKILAFPYSKYDALVCDGAVRSGKTSIMTVAFVDWAMRCFNGCRFGICGKTVDSATKNIVIPFLAVWRELQTEIEDEEWREELEEEWRYYISDFLECGGQKLDLDREIERVYQWQKSQDQLLGKIGESGYLESGKRSFSQRPISSEKLEEMTFLRKPSLVFMAWLDPDGKARKGEWRIFWHGRFYNGLDMDSLADYGKKIIAFEYEPRWEADEGFFFSGGVDSNQRSDLSEPRRKEEITEE